MPSWPDQNAPDEPAVADRQERLGNRRRTARSCRPGRRPSQRPRSTGAAEEPAAIGRRRRARGARSAARRAPSTSSVPPLPRWSSSREHISGVSVSDTMPLAKIETMIVTENSRKIRPDQPGHEHQRQEHRRQRDRHRQNREADLAGAVAASPSERLIALLHAAGRCSPGTRSRRPPGNRSPASGPSARDCRGCTPAPTSR